MIKITDIIVFPYAKKDSSIKAFVRVILDDCITLNGLKIIKDQFGHFVSYPSEKGSPYKHVDIISISFRKHMQREILKHYAIALSKEVQNEKH